MQNSLKNKSILVTGGAGFIGRHLIKYLKKDGFIVTAISLKSGEIEGIKIIPLNLLQTKEVTAFFKKNHFDIICHLAAKIPKNDNFKEQKEAFLENITSTMNILDIFQKTPKIKKIIYASSISIIGFPASASRRRDGPHGKIKEDYPSAPETLYALSKLIGETLVEKVATASGKDYASLRICAPYGPGQNPLDVIPLFIQYALSDKAIPIYGTGKRSQDFIYISDVVEAIVSAIKYRGRGIYNIASGKDTSTISLAKIILKNIPETKSQIKFVKITDPQENYRLKMDISKAARDLKFRPKIMIEEGIEKYIKYLREFK